MTTTVDTIRTVFDAQFVGAATFKQVVQQVQSTQSALERLQGALGGGARGVSDFQKALDARKLQAFNQYQARMADLVFKQEASFDAASAKVEEYRTHLFGAQEATVAMSSGMKTALVAAGGLALGIAAVGTALYKLYPIAQEGAGLAQLEMSFDRLNQNVLQTPGLLKDMQSAARGTITTFDTMGAFLTLTAGASDELSQRFAQAAPRLMEIAKAANVLNPTLGDTNYMFNSLARGIKRNEIRLLDNLGIIIKTTESNKRYAESVGKSVRELSAEEKQMATLNEVLRVGQNLINQVGGDIDSLVDPYMRLGTAWEQLGASIKMAIADAYPVGGVEGLTDMLTTQQLAIEANKKIEQSFKDGTISLKEYGTLQDLIFLSRKEDLVEAIDTVNKKINERAEYTKFARSELEKYVQAQGGIDPLFGPEGPPLLDTSYMRTWVPKNAFDNTIQDADDMARALKGIEDAAYYASIAGKAATDVFQEMFGDEIAKNNAAVFKKWQEEIAKTGDLLMQWSGDNSLFTRPINELGDAFIAVGGRTEDQNALLEDFRSAQKKADEQVRDYTTGLKGFGEEQDKINEKIQEGADRSAFYAQKVAELEAVQSDLQKVHQGAVWNMEAIYAELINQNDAAGANVDLLAKLKIATGEWTEEQARAAIKSAALADALERIADGGAPAIDQLMALGDTMRGLENINWDNVFRPWQQVNRDLPGMNRQVGKLKEGWQQANDPYGGFYDEINPVMEERYAQATRDELEQYFPGLVEPETFMIEASLDPESLAIAEAEIARLTATEKKYIEIVMLEPGAPKFGNKPDNVGTRAAGGPVSAHVPYIVGERGPELFVPNSSGTIVPNDKVGAGITINNYNYTAAAAAVAAASAEFAMSGTR